MNEAPTTSTLAEKADISLSYASEIVNGKRRPSRPLAIHILRVTGWRHSLLAGLTDEQIAALEAVQPWTPRSAEAA
ncbi:MAG: helix-turn-helix domain-containing protein [Sphingomonas sp.]